MAELSVIVPTRNRGESLNTTLEALCDQPAVSFAWEVLVIDNASTDGTKERVSEISKSAKVPIRYCLEPSVGLHNCRHRGLREAKGECVAFLDDDMTVSSDWVKGVRLVQQGKADAVVGKVLAKWDKEPELWLCDLVAGESFPHLTLLNLGDEVKSVHAHYIYGGNCFLKKEMVIALGGFHPDSFPKELIRYRGDGETGLMDKFIEQGLDAYYDPIATAYHQIGAERMTEDYLCERSFREGISRSFADIRAGSVLADGEIESKCEGSKLEDPSLKERMNHAFWKGYKYHQEQVHSDPELLEYVLKESYLA